MPEDHAEPRPAQLPLPGGTPGSTVKVHPLRTATMQAMPAFLQRPSGPLAELRGLGLHTSKKRWSSIPLPAFLVEHPTAGPILVDTGMHAAYAKDPAEHMGALAARFFDITMEERTAAPAQLRERGVDPDDVRLVLMTHLHYDHASGISQFPNATFVVDRREWAAATGHLGLLKGYRRQLFDHPYDWRTLDFEAPSVEGYVTFGRAIDLLGDGSIRLVSTPGHAEGHYSVVLRLLGDRELLLTGDAAYAIQSIEEDLVPTFCDDIHDYKRSLGEIRHFREHTGATTICGHDAASWPTLDALYA
ncbi:MAG: N-acyl homoserine lactone hydrolase [Frankiaceae bacterium]|nr:N-acyl homoserine lactone hydrolase [Frankiaceae bacterium]